MEFETKEQILECKMSPLVLLTMTNKQRNLCKETSRLAVRKTWNVTEEQSPFNKLLGILETHQPTSRDRLVVRTLRCGRNNPGSNPGHGRMVIFFIPFQFISHSQMYKEFDFLSKVFHFDPSAWNWNRRQTKLSDKKVKTYQPC